MQKICTIIAVFCALCALGINAGTCIGIIEDYGLSLADMKLNAHEIVAQHAWAWLASGLLSLAALLSLLCAGALRLMASRSVQLQTADPG